MIDREPHPIPTPTPTREELDTNAAGERLAECWWYLGVRWYAWRLSYFRPFVSGRQLRCFEDYRLNGYSPREAVLEDLSYA